MEEFISKGWAITKEPIMVKKYEIPKELMVAISNLDLNGSQWKILWNVFMNNYDNASKEMSLVTLTEATGYCKKQVQRELKRLFERRILTETIKPDCTNARVMNINRSFTEWKMH